MTLDAYTFLLGTLIGMGLFLAGVVLGWWIRRFKEGGASPSESMHEVIEELAQWTNDVSGDVSKYQSELSDLLNQVVNNKDLPPDQMQALLTKMSQINQDLQLRLQEAETRLEKQAGQVESYAEASRTDALTGLLNRRAFDYELDSLYKRWSQEHRPFALTLIDIDHFKKINDKYGHPAGDAVLRSVARLLQTELADAVCVARFGGEEFAVLSLEKMELAARDIDRVRDRVASTRFEFEGQVIPVSLSAGVAEIQADDSIGDVVRRADEALYASKLGGRNRVSKHDGILCHQVTVAPKPPATSATGRVYATGQSDELRSRIEQRLRNMVAEESKKIVD